MSVHSDLGASSTPGPWAADPAVRHTQTRAEARRPADTEDRILQAAARVFARLGYHRSSVADIAAEAGVAAGTIYLYFERKEDLLVRLVRRPLEAYLEECRPLLAAAAPGAARLRRLIELHLSFYERDHELARVLQIHLREVQPAIHEGIQPALRACFELMDEVLRDGVAAGEFDPQLDVRLARKLLFGGLDEVVTSWVLSERRYPLLSVVEPFHRLAARALGAPQNSDRHAAHTSEASPRRKPERQSGR